MPLRIAINGFGRIGRAAFKIAFERDQEVEVAAINDLGNSENLAYLLRYDSVYGRYAHEVQVEADEFVVDGKRVKVLKEKDPAKLPWADMAVDVVIESTGFFTEEAGARGHLTAGARRVIISAPTKSESVATVVLGVNDKDMAKQEIISNASCTTNSAAPMVAVLDNVFGIAKALLTTAHAYTATQELVDAPAHDDFRRGRAGGINIVPSSTGAAIAATKTLPHLAGKFDGVSLRVPVPVVSITDLTCLLKKNVTAEEVNNAFRQAAADPLYRGVIAVTDEPLVSSDFIGDPHSVIIDMPLTRVVDGNLVKVMGWYDNEWGYSNRLVEQVIEIGKSLAG